MEDNRYVKVSIVLFFGLMAAILLLQPFFVFAYSVNTHEALTDESVDFFNTKFTELILGEEKKELIKQGSINEDDGARALNHFYDPVYNRGLVLKEGIEGGENLAVVGASKVEYSSSKNWASNSGLQAGLAALVAGSLTGYFSSGSDYSWERAIYEY